MRVHFVLIAIVMVVAVLLQIGKIELLLLFFCIALVLITELFNTALEAAVDIGVQSFDPLAGLAKDVAAGAVLVAAINAVLVASVLFATSPRLGHLLAEIPPIDWNSTAARLGAVGTILMSLIIIAIKTRTGKGTLMRGGVVSGHTALAFFFATMVILTTRNGMASLFALAIAGMLAHSRVQAEIHSITQVMLGALVGCCLTVFFYTFLYLTGSLPAGPGL